MRNDLKQPETTYNGQKTTWNDLQRARKRPETTYSKQETTWNDLQRAFSEWNITIYFLLKEEEVKF